MVKQIIVFTTWLLTEEIQLRLLRLICVFGNKRPDITSGSQLYGFGKFIFNALEGSLKLHLFDQNFSIQ